MPTNKLTDSKIRKLKDGPLKVSDGGGLFLYITPHGAKVWRMAYRLNGKQQQASFGEYPGVTLAQAREAREALKAKLRAGDDPRSKRHKSIPDVREVVSTYWAQREDISDRHRSNIMACMERVVFPVIGSMRCDTVKRDDAMRALSVLNDAGRFDYVRKARIWLEMAFDWATPRGWCEVNPAALIDPSKAFGKKQVQHFAAIDHGEVGEFMRRLDLEKTLSAMACRLLAYTWLRTKELRHIRKADVSGAVLTVNAGTMKLRKEHVVPLSTQALALIDQIKSLKLPGDLLFPGDRNNGKPISDNTVLALIHRMGYKGRMTGHGWRSVGSTWANEHGWNADAIERQLAHTPTDKVRSAYNRAKYMDERRRMLQAWADWVEAQAQG